MVEYKIIIVKLLLILLTINLHSFDIVEKYPSYSYVLSEFEIDSSYIVDREFQTFIRKKESSLKRFYKSSLARGGHYLPTFKYMLIENDMSDLFIYLSMIESGLKADAISPKKAGGLWQFMPSTARIYNLTFNGYIDQRYDPILSTNSAIKYLKTLHKKFGKWYLAIMAYNCGEGRLSKAIKKAGSDDISILTNNEYKYLPKETRDYIKKIILLAMIGENISLGFEESNTLYKYDDITEVELKKGANLYLLAQKIDMSIDEFFTLNPHIQKSKILNQDCKIIIPKDKLAQYYILYDALISKDIESKIVVKKNHLISYIATKKISVEEVAKENNSTMAEIFITNNFSKEFLEEGEVIIIPVSQDRFDNM
ncbi:Membrane-bound lytic murein transglycosylase D precursor [hydrothermal vent metagenome]|uniref:Membrane-bound lytic murein transglycosylase D n=1 Tax=hydrothermal vent metagenome TaxID=652676 RepID=A0A1W1EKW0_9ZZZZ